MAIEIGQTKTLCDRLIILFCLLISAGASRIDPSSENYSEFLLMSSLIRCQKRFQINIALKIFEFTEKENRF